MPTWKTLAYKKGMITQHSVTGSAGEIVILVEAKVDNPTTAPAKPEWDGTEYRIGSIPDTLDNATASANCWKDAVKAYITDDDLIRVGETIISWPDAQTKLNFCTCRFLNESKDFREDVAFWPNKLGGEDGMVYDGFYRADNQVELESDIQAIGTTSYYLAKAKAEYTVRSSRESISYTFSVNRDYLFLEPGDIIKLQSDVMQLPRAIPKTFLKEERALYGDLVVIREVVPDNEGSIKITANRYDARFLSWNVADDESPASRRLYNRDIAQARSLALVKEDNLINKSAGTLTWLHSTDDRVDRYIVKMAPVGIPSSQTPWQDIGVVTGLKLALPDIRINDYLITVVAAAGSRLAPQKGWPILNTGVGLQAVTSLELQSTQPFFVARIDDVTKFKVDQIWVYANTTGYEKPTFTWQLGSTGHAAATKSTLTYANGEYRSFSFVNGVPKASTGSLGYINKDGVWYDDTTQAGQYSFSYDHFVTVGDVTTFYDPDNKIIEGMHFLNGPCIIQPAVPPGSSVEFKCTSHEDDNLDSDEMDELTLYSFREGQNILDMYFDNQNISYLTKANPAEEVNGVSHIAYDISPISQLDKKIKSFVVYEGEVITNKLGGVDNAELAIAMMVDSGQPYIEFTTSVIGCKVEIGKYTGIIKIKSIEEANAFITVNAKVYLAGLDKSSMYMSDGITEKSTFEIIPFIGIKPADIGRIATLSLLEFGDLVKVARIGAGQNTFIIPDGKTYDELKIGDLPMTLLIEDISTGYSKPVREWDFSTTSPLDNASHPSFIAQMANCVTANGTLETTSGNLSVVAFPSEFNSRRFTMKIYDNVTLPTGSESWQPERLAQYRATQSDSLSIYSVKESDSTYVLRLSDDFVVIPSNKLGYVNSMNATFDITCRVLKSGVEMPLDGITFSAEANGPGISGVLQKTQPNIFDVTIDANSPTPTGFQIFKAVVNPKVTVFATMSFSKTFTSQTEDGPLDVEIFAASNEIAFIKELAATLWTPDHIHLGIKTSTHRQINVKWSCSAGGTLENETGGSGLTASFGSTDDIDGDGSVTYSNGVVVRHSSEYEGPIIVGLIATDDLTGEMVSDRTTLFAIVKGSSAFNIALTNQSQIISCDSQGKPIGSIDVVSQIICARGTQILTEGVASGATDADPIVTYSIYKMEGCIASIVDTTSDVASVIINTLLPNFTEGYATVEAIVWGTADKVLTKLYISQNWYKSNGGLDAPMVKITCNRDSFTKLNTGVIEPSDGINFAVDIRNMGNAPTIAWTDGSTVLASTNGGLNCKVTLGDLSLTKRSRTIRCTVTSVSLNDQVSIYDEEAIYFLVDGDDAIIVDLENSTQSVSCLSDGTPRISTVISKMTARRGFALLPIATPTLNIPVEFRTTATQLGLTCKIDSSGGIEVLGFSKSTAIHNTLAFIARINDVDYTSDLTINMMKEGVNAPLLVIDESSVVFKKNKEGVVSPDAQTLHSTFSGFDLGVTPAYTWTGGMNDGRNRTSSSLSIVKGDVAENTPCTYKIVGVGLVGGVSTTVTDSIQVPLLVDGSSVPWIDLSNDNITLAAPVTGYVGILWGTAGCTVNAAIGADYFTFSSTAGSIHTYTVSLSNKVSCTTDFTASTKTVSISAMSADSASVDVDVSFYGASGQFLITTKRTISYSLSRTGATSTIAGSSVDIIFTRANRTLTVAPTASTGAPTYSSDEGPLTWVTTIPAGTDFLWSSYGVKPSNSIATPNPLFVWQKPVRVEGESVIELAVYMLVAVNANSPGTPSDGTYTKSTGLVSGLATGWSQHLPTVSAGQKVYESITVATGSASSLTLTPMTWSTPVLILTGPSSAYTLELTNDSATVSTNSDGTGGVVSNAEAYATTAKIYNGSILETASNWSFVWSSSTINPTSSSGNTYTPTSITAAGQLVDALSVTVTATDATTQGRSSHTATYNITKNRNGQAGVVYWIVASTTAISKSTDGAFTPTTFSFTAMKQVGAGTPGAATDATLTLNDISYTSGGSRPSTASAQTCKMYIGGTLVDTETIPLISDGPKGDVGESTTTVTIYRQIASPGVPSGGTYNFSSKLFSNDVANWTSIQPSASTVPVWASTRIYVGLPINTPNDTGTWSTPYIETQQGAAGVDGLWIDVLQLYNQATSAPSAPSNVTYNFNSNSFGGIGNNAIGSWFPSQPTASTTPTYLSTARATTKTPSTTIPAASLIWSAPVIVAQNGSNGVSINLELTTSGYLYKSVAVGSSIPAIPTNVFYSFGNNNFYDGVNAVANGFTGGAGASYLNGWSIQPTAASKDFDNYAVYYSAMSSPGLDKARQWMTTYFLGWNRPEILFGSPSKSIVFNGIVTFTNSTTSDINSVLNSSAVTTIDGGKITTGSISADRIGTGTFTKASKGYFQMGLGTQYSIPGDITVATIGVFVSTSHDAALIAVNESSNIAFAAKTTSSANAALFNCGNNYGATVAAADCGFFSMRGLNSKLYGSSPLASNTRTWAKLSQDAVAAEIYYCHNTNGILKWKGVSIGTGGETPGYGLTVVGGTSPFTGCHDGIMPESAEEAIGDILVDVEVVRRAGISDTVTLVRYSNKINEKGVVGVLYHFSGKAVPHMFTKPVELIKIESGAYVRYTEYVNDFGEDMIGRRFIAMNSIGEGQVNVCGENGNIEIGDLITTSSIPGKGMKQADDLVRNYTVAKSRENVSFSSPTEIKQIACIYMCG